MSEGEKVCIKCRTAGALKTIQVCDGKKVVGILYSCAHCFREIHRYRVDIFFTEQDKASIN
jgi:hypothetical protein